MIEVRGVSKTYSGDIKAVDGLEFTVGDGEIVGFIGPNGAGKTTALKMMTGILRPDKGEVLINGISMQKDPIEAKEIIGYIADSPDMFLRLKGIEFLDLVADVYKVPLKERREKIEFYASRFGLDTVLEKPMQGYSHGMRQKMMVTAALIHNPKVWILDEPLIGLDPKSAHELKSMMREHADAGNSVLFSTHVLEVAEKLCDRVLIINHGVKAFYGSFEELKSTNPTGDLETVFLELTADE